jgi:hypothetical protein
VELAHTEEVGVAVSQCEALWVGEEVPDVQVLSVGSAETEEL